MRIVFVVYVAIISLATCELPAQQPTVILGQQANSPGRLIYSGTAEYGWSKGSVSSRAPQEAINESLEQIRGKINSMLNIYKFSEFVGTDVTRNLDVSGSYSKVMSSGRVKASESRSQTGSVEWIANGNNWLIVISNVRIKDGTWFSRTEKTWKGERTSRASATVFYDYAVYGPELSPAKQERPMVERFTKVLFPSGGVATRLQDNTWLEIGNSHAFEFRFRTVNETQTEITIRDDSRRTSISLPKDGGIAVMKVGDDAAFQWGTIRWLAN